MTQQTFLSRLSRHPIAFDADAGGEARQLFAALGPEVAPLLSGAAGCSPFLAASMQQEADWLHDALIQPPEVVQQTELALLDRATTEQLGPALRLAKRRLALLAALCDLGGVWSLQEVTGALTDLADRAVNLSLQHLVAAEIRRGRLPGASADDAVTAGGMVVFAMGKMGARELNYSSDIDLICLFDETRYPGNAQEARAAFLRVTRKMMALVSDRTAPVLSVPRARCPRC